MPLVVADVVKQESLLLLLLLLLLLYEGADGLEPEYIRAKSFGSASRQARNVGYKWPIEVESCEQIEGMSLLGIIYCINGLQVSTSNQTTEVDKEVGFTFIVC